ncbi:hypothetical protein G4Y73_03665 [Wenzhouxiangella sp. XN201]|uniref:Mur ligase family protein n=1 Tax=Wenzhouxiangella sp. XN201 TaxID=2710755 RepID=UPI0013CA81B6|nr:Mur ligase family protein [Wenzhouxiangella sp. XN201]NEZ03246.1 hypothetical protein [Wenzhouxiangella sp. XN201]
MHEQVTFYYGGPNRRSDRPVIERVLVVNGEELACFAASDRAQWQARLGDLHEALVADAADRVRAIDSLSTPDQLAHLYAQTCISLQRAAGHLVRVTGRVATAEPNQCRPFFEYEEEQTGAQGGEIALQALNLVFSQQCPSCRDDGTAETVPDELKARIDNFLSDCSRRAMPADSRAILEAAAERGIPCLRMDRPPYEPIEGSFRLRYNGLFRLGHGHRQHTVDGTFCVSRSESVFSLVRDRSALFEWLAAQSVPLPGNSPGQWCQSAVRAAKAAERIGYPVRLRAGRRGTVRQAPRQLADRDSVLRAAQFMIQYTPGLLVQASVPGTAFLLVVAGCRLIAVFERNDEGEETWRTVDDFHASLETLAIELAESLSVGLMSVTLVTPDIRVPLEHSGGAVVDVELAPRLDRLFEHDDPRLHRAAGAFVDWIFPDPEQSRIPLIAVTGTNGKTTTCRFLDRILAAAGMTCGLACSDGSFVASRQISNYEDGFLPGHITVLDNPEVEAAVLESTRGAAGSTGLGFERCDVAICLNVTADHLNDFVGVRTVEQLAELKRTILERARRAVVLCADDPHCRNMIRHFEDRTIGLVSLTRTAAELTGLGGAASAAGVLEEVDHRPWLVIHHRGQRIQVAAVSDIPLAFEGAAEHNVLNALHAAVAAYLTDMPVKAIACGLCALEPVYESVPGRLTFYRELPFDVCMDYAHNPAGVQTLCDFVDRLPVAGRRILCFSCSNANSNDFIRETGAAAAGRFDHYICKNFSKLFGREPHEGPRLLSEGLAAAGVPPDAMTCIESEPEAIDAALAMGRPGDLVVIVGGKRRDALWEQILRWKTET